MKKRVKERERESNAMQKRIILISRWIGRGQKWTAYVLSNSRNSLAEAVVYLKLSVLYL